jgi:hypothetical protein
MDPSLHDVIKAGYGDKKYKEKLKNLVIILIINYHQVIIKYIIMIIIKNYYLM